MIAIHWNHVEDLWYRPFEVTDPAFCYQQTFRSREYEIVPIYLEGLRMSNHPEVVRNRKGLEYLGHEIIAIDFILLATDGRVKVLLFILGYRFY